MNKPTKILVVENNSCARGALTAYISLQVGVRITVEASNGLEADGLKILTNNSKINVTGQMKNYNIFGNNSSSALKKSQIAANVNANVNLQDLGNFVTNLPWDIAKMLLQY